MKVQQIPFLLQILKAVPNSILFNNGHLNLITPNMAEDNSSPVEGFAGWLPVATNREFLSPVPPPQVVQFYRHHTAHTVWRQFRSVYGHRYPHTKQMQFVSFVLFIQSLGTEFSKFSIVDQARLSVNAFDHLLLWYPLFRFDRHFEVSIMDYLHTECYSNIQLYHEHIAKYLVWLSDNLKIIKSHDHRSCPVCNVPHLPLTMTEHVLTPERLDIVNNFNVDAYKRNLRVMVPFPYICPRCGARWALSKTFAFPPGICWLCATDEETLDIMQAIPG